MEKIITVNRSGRTEAVFKAPTLDENVDVEHFILRFGEISAANCWRDNGTLQNLRETL